MYFGGLVVIVLFISAIATTSSALAENQIKKIRSVRIDGATSERPIVHLGKFFDKKINREVEGYAIVHYAKSFSRPAKPGSGSICRSYISRGAKWKNVEPWTVDTTNSGLGSSYVLQNIYYDISKWEDATDGTIDNKASADILGSGSLGTASLTLGNQLDYKNEIEFASIDNAGAIAVTYIWGIFSGPTSQKQIVEWDQVYNTDYSWSAGGEAEKMDFENIATHELGHAVGMGDLYNSRCTQETMYGYAHYGETKKRDLNIGDIAGINALY